MEDGYFVARVPVGAKYGIHMRVAVPIVTEAKRHPSTAIEIGRNGTSGGTKYVDATSILDVLVLNANHGTELTIRAKGVESEACAAVSGIAAIVCGKR